jgi:hypothetical protein
MARSLTYLSFVLFALLGLSPFLAPQATAPVFPWKVSTFVAMTIGGWCLGNAWLAWLTARRWRGRMVYSTAIYLALFGGLELAVAAAFRGKLVLTHPLAWLYLASLAAGLAAGLLRGIGWLRDRPRRMPFGRPIRPLHRAFMVAFILFVGFLAIYGLVAPLGAPGTSGGIFPEQMSLFTLRSFAAFYLALALGVVALLREPSLEPVLHHSFASAGLILAITAAAVFHLRLFDFLGRPGGLLYFGAYLAVGALVLIAFLTKGTGDEPSEPSGGDA